MSDRLRVLLVEDSDDDTVLILRELKRAGFDFEYKITENWQDFVHYLSQESWDVVLSDYSLPTFNGLDAIEKVREVDKDLPFILVSGAVGEETAVAALKAGAQDFITKNNLSRLVPVIQRELKEAETRRENRKAQQALQRLGTAIEQAAEAVLITDVNGIIEYVNPAFERITGYSVQEALGKNPRILKSNKNDAKIYKEMWDTLLSGEVWIGRLINKKKDNTFFETEAIISPVRDKDNKIANFVAVNRDITAEVHMENQMRQMQKMEAVGRLAGGIAHDLNNVLTPIIGYSDLVLMRMKPNESFYKELIEIQKSAEKAKELILQLLAFSRKQALQLGVIDLRYIVHDMEKMLKRIIRENIQIEISLPNELHKIEADVTQLQQILLNLGVNAQDAMPSGGKLMIECQNVEIDNNYTLLLDESKPGQYVMLSFSDTGTGMDSETISHIFEPFFTTKDIGKGTGLGLATVYGIVKQHGGFITVRSEEGMGSTFRVYLPAIEDVETSANNKTEHLPIRDGDETIILVEDDEAIRKMTSEILIACGYNTIIAKTPGHCLSILENYPHKVDLMITDIIMPEINGRDLYRQAVKLRNDMKVIFMSGYDESMIANTGMLDQGKPFISKPFTLQVLLRKIRQVLDND